ncbi:hypothetical protein ALC60_09537, partial [Trachymyrmex zeteki]
VTHQSNPPRAEIYCSGFGSNSPSFGLAFFCSSEDFSSSLLLVSSLLSSEDFSSEESSERSFISLATSCCCCCGCCCWASCCCCCCSSAAGRLLRRFRRISLDLGGLLRLCGLLFLGSFQDRRVGTLRFLLGLLLSSYLSYLLLAFDWFLDFDSRLLGGCCLQLLTLFNLLAFLSWFRLLYRRGCLRYIFLGLGDRRGFLLRLNRFLGIAGHTVGFVIDLGVGERVTLRFLRRDCRERESAGRRGTGDIEPNASNKANIMELMTGCVPLTLIQTHVNLLRRDARKIFHRLRDLPGKMVAGWRPRVNVAAQVIRRLTD